MLRKDWENEVFPAVLSLAKQYGTPLYYLDGDILRNNIRHLRSLLPKEVAICFSVKSNPWFVETALKEAEFVEICSPGEMRLCLERNIPVSCLLAGGVSKTENECAFLAKLEHHRTSVESQHQLRILSHQAKKYGVELPVQLRLSSGNQFGMSFEEIQNILLHQDMYPGIRFVGLHYYSGTQKKRAETVQQDLDVLLNAVKLLNIQEIEYGPGIGVPLFQNQQQSDFADCMEVLSTGVKMLSQRCNVIIECGRLFSANAGIYVTKILEQKENQGKIFWIVDGGIHHLNYYGQMNGKPHPVMWQENKTGQKIVTVCGSLCTVSDILAKDIPLAAAEPGDFLLFLNAGAYAVTEGRNLFLSRDMPGILYCENGAVRQVRMQTPTYPLNMP